MKRIIIGFIFVVLAAALSQTAGAITATKEYVDRKTGTNAAAIAVLDGRVEGISGTVSNNVDRLNDIDIRFETTPTLGDISAIADDIIDIVKKVATNKTEIASLASNVYSRAETDARIVELSPRTSLEPATNYTDSVISNYLTRKEAESGYTEWVFGDLQGMAAGQPAYSNNHWFCVAFYDGQEYDFVDEIADENATNITLISGVMYLNATRHRITPNALSQMSNDVGFVASTITNGLASKTDVFNIVTNTVTKAYVDDLGIESDTAKKLYDTQMSESFDASQILDLASQTTTNISRHLIGLFSASGTVANASWAGHADNSTYATYATSAVNADKLANRHKTGYYDADDLLEEASRLANTNIEQSIYEYSQSVNVQISDQIGESLGDYVTFPDLENYVTFENLEGYTTFEDATNITQDAIGNFAETGTVSKANYADYAVDAGYTDYTLRILSTNEPPHYYTVDEIFSKATNIAQNAAAEATADLATKAEVQAVSNEAQVVYRLYSGSNVVCEVTNYNSSVHAPTLRLMQLNESNEYFTVWTETNGLMRTLAQADSNATEMVDALRDFAKTNFSPRAWSRTTSGLGAEAPSNTTWISTPTTVIAGGLEYSKIVHANGAVWVLSGNGMMSFDPTTNAYLRISAEDGTEVFSIEKTDAVTVGAFADGIEVSGNTVTIPVNVVSAEHPTAYYRQTLDSGSWEEASGGVWSGASGAWVFTVTMNPLPSSGFFKFTYEQPGSTVIRNGAATDVSGGILCTDGIHKVRPVYSNGAVTWEVMP